MDTTRRQPGLAGERRRRRHRRKAIRNRILSRHLRILAVPSLMALLAGAFAGSGGGEISFAAKDEPAGVEPVAVARPTVPQPNAPQPRPGRDAESPRQADPLILLTESGEQP